jgi:hypothetical protein
MAFDNRAALGVKLKPFNFILPAKDAVLFVKYYDEYSAKARAEGHTIVFGGSWTLRIPKPVPAKP